MERSKTRKPHKKSRHGCLPCKSRHVKCDEQKPDCANCVKQETPCKYRRSIVCEESIRSLTPAVLTPSSGEGTSADQAFPSSALNTSPDLSLNITQLRLLHHYTTITARTLAHNAASEEVFTTNLVRTAFEHPYLLHAVLALAALHLSRTEDMYSPAYREYRILSERHYDTALTEFRATVRNIDQTNWKAVLMFSGAIFPHSCAAPVSVSDDVNLAFSNFLSNLALTRRVRPMVSGFYNEILQSELSHMVPDDVKGMDWEAKEAPADTELVQLRKFSEAVHHLYPPDIVDAYGYAIHILILSFAVAARSSEQPSDALLKIWIHFISDRYVELLTERQPGSLIILAHYAVLVNRSKRYWFLDGVAEQILSIADAFVPTEWKTWLAWPRAQIRELSTTPSSS